MQVLLGPAQERHGAPGGGQGRATRFLSSTARCFVPETSPEIIQRSLTLVAFHLDCLLFVPEAHLKPLKDASSDENGRLEGPGGGGPAEPARHHELHPGEAVQVELMKHKLKPSGTKRLKLRCDILLSTSAFNSTCAATPWRCPSTARRRTRRGAGRSAACRAHSSTAVFPEPMTLATSSTTL